ncbi:MAG: sodium:solute symporter family protein [Ruminococcus sp.]|nr:sodium:solute symporter family protein [Ruminococcus sp.]
MFIKILFIVLFLIVTIGVGIYCRKKATDVNGFVLGGRAVGPWLTAFSFGTSYFSAVIFVGYAGQFGWNFGLASTWIGLGNALIGSYLAWRVLGRRTRVMTQHLGSATMPDFFEKRYDSKALKLMAAAIVFIFMIPYTASLYNGLSRLFEMAFGIDYWICVVIMAFVTGLYVVLSGYVGTALNSLIQGIIMLVGIVVVVISVLNVHGGLAESVRLLSEVSSDTAGAGVYTSFLGPDPVALLGVVLLTSLGTWGLPQMIGKFYAIKSEKSIMTGTIVSTVFAVIVAGGCYFLGGFGRIFVTQDSVDANGVDSIIPAMLEMLQSDVVIALVIMLVLAASMSTLSSLVLTSSSTLTLDFIDPMKKKPMSESSKMIVMRIFLVFFIVVSAGIAIVQANTKVAFITDLMGISWGTMSGAFLGPFMLGLYWKRATKPAVWTSFIFSVCINVTFMAFKLSKNTAMLPKLLQTSSNVGVVAMLMGIVLVIVVSLATKKPDKNKVDEMFSCYDKQVVVSAKERME